MAAAAAAAMVSAAGSGAGFGNTLSSTLTSTLSSTLTSARSGEDELGVGVDGFDPAEFDEMYGGGGGGGVDGVFQGHPSVEPKEEGIPTTACVCLLSCSVQCLPFFAPVFHVRLPFSAHKPDH